MKIAGYEILRERGHWVEEGRLYSPLFYQTILDKLDHFIKNPDWSGYSVRYDLQQKRIRIDNLRIYLRLYPDMSIVTILAVVIKGAIAADNVGSLSGRFINYLQSHRHYVAERFIPLLSLEEFEAGNAQAIDPTEYYAPAPAAPTPEPSFPWGPILTSHELSEKEAAELLLGDNVIRPMDQISANLMAQIERAFPGDKVLVPLPPGSDNWEKWMVRSLQFSIRHRLAVMGKHYSVRYDDISRKFILIPPDKIQTYALSRVGRMPRAADQMEVQNAR